ncbi:hypothetical protein [Roseospirillum parvum]|uniref:ADP-heptose:LPS heptosyltransferase n=1 Tax=Roseospirillum parvum TaxID=83401 RepID=A0A1G7UNG2_9PROT|nr:hypothetical protein [Roseospirillum parvum]SDG49135.1 hypothetical protein SAMN05421742_101386 [Roseospirillum parvum]
MPAYPVDQQYDTYRDFQRRAGARPDEWLFVCAYGIGDTYMTCGLAMAFKDQMARRGAPGRLAVAVKKSQIEVARLFEPLIDRIVAFEAVDLEALFRFSRFEPGQPIIAHPFHYGDGRLCHWLTREGVHLLDLHRFMMDLPFDAMPAPPVVPADQRQAARARLEGWGLPRGRTVLLAPHAYSTATLPLGFWNTLTARLKAAGWEVVLNVDPRFPVTVEGARPIEFPLGEALPVADHCGWVISSRSGLTDILSTTRARLSVLYPRFADGWGQSWNPRTAYDLAAMGLRPGCEQHVAVIDGDWAPVLDALLAGPNGAPSTDASPTDASPTGAP